MDIYILVKIKTEWTLVHRAKIFIDAIHFIIWTRPAVIQELSENIDFEIKRALRSIFKFWLSPLWSIDVNTF